MRRRVDVQMLPYLRSQFKLDLIHEDEPIGVMRLWPAQKHPVLMTLPGHWSGYVISLFWTTTWRLGYHGDHRGLDVQQPRVSSRNIYGTNTHRKTGSMTLQWSSNMLTSLYYICKQISSPLTCRLGSREDELSGAAALDLTIAGVNVDAVNGERLQARDLQLALRHRLLHELKLSVHRLRICGAAVTGGLERRRSAAVGVQPVAAGVSGVSYAKEISTATIWWPGGERKRVEERVGRENFFR